MEVLSDNSSVCLLDSSAQDSVHSAANPTYQSQDKNLAIILVLGFRGDTYNLVDNLEQVVHSHKLPVEVIGHNSKSLFKEYLDANAVAIPMSNFRVNLGTYFPQKGVYWPQYQDDNVKLFVCSTVTRDGDGKDTIVMHDGESFAKQILPYTPKLILHFQNKYRGNALNIGSSGNIDDPVLHRDFNNRVYHLPYNLQTKQSKHFSRKVVNMLVGNLLNGDIHDYSDYAGILLYAYNSMVLLPR